MTNRIGNAAIAALNAGISVVPVLGDGSKRPPFKWGEFQETLPGIDQVKAWFADGGYTGFALICGPVSGDLEVLDFDDAAIYDQFVETAHGVGLGELVDRIIAGYAERTPGGGMHLPYFCSQIGGNAKLARRADKEVLIETRGAGGYIIAAPSNGTVHPSGGSWSLVSGDIYSIATITPEERQSLLALARTFDELPPADWHGGDAPGAPSGPRPDSGLRPGDDFRERHGTTEAFRAIVEPHGWRLTHRRGGVGYFLRPGKDHGWSATFNHADSGLFYVFTSSTGFEAERGYNPFSVYAILNHQGDFAEAASALARQGYGKPSVSLGRMVVGPKPEPRPVAFRPTALPCGAVAGWFEDYLAHVEPTTESPDAFHVAAALTIVGACIGKRVGLLHASDRLYPNFYTLLIGPSGRSRKDTAVRRMLDMFYAIPPPGEPLMVTSVPFTVARDISSSEGLIAMLKESANMVLYTSEFAKVMSNASRESTSSIGPTLIEAFDCPPSLQNNKVANIERTDNKPREARNPFVSVISTVQPEILAELIGSQQQYSGFLNRWLLVVGDGKEPRPNPPQIDAARSWRLIKRLMDTIRGYPEHTLLRFDDDATERWTDWYIGSYPSGRESAQEDAMGIRRGTIVKKIALVHAVTQGATAVTLAHLESGISFADWAWGHTKALLPMWGESKDAEMARKMIEKLNQRGPMKKRDLQMLVGNRMGPGVFARIIKSMVENGDIVVGEHNVVGIRTDE